MRYLVWARAVRLAKICEEKGYGIISSNFISCMNDFEAAINKLDLQLFEKITSQSTDHDKQSLLACQLAVRELRPDYNYLEI